MPRTNDYTGHEIAGKLILGRSDSSYGKSPKWDWRCLNCGFEGPAASWCNLRGLEAKHCTTCRNCMAPRLKAYPVGTRVNNLEVTGACRKNGKNPNGSSRREVPCRCVKCGASGWWNKSNVATGTANCACEKFVQGGLSNTHVGILWSHAKTRAEKQGVPFEITHEDIKVPEACPVLGIPLERGQGGWADGSPSLDKIIPSLGYVPGNIAVISWRANKLKSDATAEELQAIASWMETQKRASQS